MLIQLEVIVSSSIQRKKPWPRLEWVGTERESVYLFDHKRVSQLYLPSGKTKRVIASLKHVSGSVICVNTSLSGEYVVGVLQNGHLFRWHKDSNKVSSISAHPGFTPSSGQDSKKTKLFVSDDGRTIVLFFDEGKIYVWEQAFATAPKTKKGLTLPGSTPPNAEEPGQWASINIVSAPFCLGLSKEAAMDTVFFTNQIQGKCCVVSFVCNSGENMSIGTMLLQWNALHQPEGAAPFTSSFGVINYKLEDFYPPCKAVRTKGAYLAKWSRDGQTLAVAVNQRHPVQSRISFVHPYMEAVISVGLGSLGSKTGKVLARLAKTYWIASMAWTCDSVFLACITRRGSMLMLSRLGEPLTLSAYGPGVDFGPTALLPLHPLVEFDGPKKQAKKGPLPRPATAVPGDQDEVSIQSSTVSEAVWKQKFSITAHPKLPIFLCSDGYSVTALRTIDLVRPYDLATVSLAESVQRLNKIIEKHQLQVSISRPLHFLLPQETAQMTKFKENRWTVIYNNMKKRLAGKKKPTNARKPLSQIDGNVTPADGRESKKPPSGILKQTADSEETTPFTYIFEEYAKEMNENDENEDDVTIDENFSLDANSPLGTKDFDKSQRTPAGVILGADEGKISFGDLNTLKPMIDADDDEDLAADGFDGATLIKVLSRCRCRILSAMGLILTTNSSSWKRRVKDRLGEPYREEKSDQFSGDEMNNFFMSTLRLYCSVVLQLQDVAEILQWKTDPNSMTETDFNSKSSDFAGYKISIKNPHCTERSLRHVFCDDAYTLGHSLLVLSSWDSTTHSKSSLVLESVTEIIDSIHLSGRRASEGCLSPDDVLEDLFRSFVLLSRAEKHLQKVYRYHPDTMVAEGGQPGAMTANDCYNASDVTTVLHEDKGHHLHLFKSWRSFSRHLEAVENLEQPIQAFRPLVNVIAAYTQQHTDGSLVLANDFPNEEVTHADTVLKMRTHLQNYDFAQAFSSAHEMLCILISDRNSWRPEAWCSVEMLASVMASFFANLPLLLPSCRAGVLACSTVLLPAVAHAEKNEPGSVPDDRSIALESALILHSIRTSGQADMWNVDHAMLLLLSCGRMSEAAQISHLVGDWRTSLVLSAVSEKIHYAVKRKSVPLVQDFVTSALENCASDRKKLKENVVGILKERFSKVLSATLGIEIDDKVQRCSVRKDDDYSEIDPFAPMEDFSDLYTVAVMMGKDVASWSLCLLLKAVKLKCRGDLTLPVPLDFYLPAPLSYLPQLIEKAAISDESTYFESEIRFRNECSVLARTLLAAMHSSRTTHLVSSWYVRWLERESQRRTMPSSSAADSEQEGLRSLSNTLADIRAMLNETAFQKHTKENDTFKDLELDFQHRNPDIGEEAYVIASVFRETCAALWMLHVRDQLSLSLRKYQKEKEQICRRAAHVQHSDENEDEDTSEELRQLSAPRRELISNVHKCLDWLDRIWPFATFLRAEATLQDLVLCLAIDLPMNLDTISLVAKYFYDADEVSPKVEGRLKFMLQKMRQVGIPVRKPQLEMNKEDGDATVGSGVTMQPLSVFYNDECKRLMKAKTEKLKKGKCINDHCHVFMTYQLSKDTGDPGTLKSVSFQGSLEPGDPLMDSASSLTYIATQSTPENLLKALGEYYAFESDDQYHEYVSEFLNITLNRMSPSTRSPSRRGKARHKALPPLHFPLILSYRNEIASLELENVAQEKDKEVSTSLMSNSLLKDRMSSRRLQPPSHSSTPKSVLRKSHSSSDLGKSILGDLPSEFGNLKKYFSQPDIKSVTKESNSPVDAVDIPRFNIADLPPHLCKSLVRLASYFSWLEHWNQKSVGTFRKKYAVTTKPQSAMRVRISSEQLMHGYTVAELRFGKKPKHKQKDLLVTGTATLTQVSAIPEEEELSETHAGEATMPKTVGSEQETYIATAETLETAQDLANESELAISAAVKSHLLEGDDKSVNPAETSASQADAPDEVTQTAPEPTAGIGCSKKAPEPENTAEKMIALTAEQVERTSPIMQRKADGLPIDVVPDLPFSDVASTGLQSDVMADGGGRMRPARPSTSTQRSHKRDQPTDVGTVVRNEIQNVLLAQQVSLLSQILLGQTLTGGPQSTTGLVNPMQILQNMTSQGQGQPGQLADDQRFPQASAGDSPGTSGVNQRQQRFSHSQTGPLLAENLDARPPAQSLNNRFAIPLFHVPGITKSQDPRPAPLVCTPDSKRAWIASQEYKNRNSGMRAPPPPAFAKLIRLGGSEARVPPTRQTPYQADSFFQRQSQPNSSKNPNLSPKSRRHVDGHAAYFQPQRAKQDDIAPPASHNLAEYEEEDIPSREYEQPRDPGMSRPIQPHTAPENLHLPLLKLLEQDSKSHLYEERPPGPAGRGIYRTKYPILNSPKPVYQGPPIFTAPEPRVAWGPPKPQSARPAPHWDANTHHGGFTGFPTRGLEIGPTPRLIDPREVLAYESQKRGGPGQFFQSVKFKAAPTRHPVLIPPVPIMKVAAPPFESGMEPTRDIPSRPTTPERKKVSFADPTRATQDSTTSPRQSDSESVDKEIAHFDGYASQDEIKQEFENAAAMHYMATVGKEQMANKARTKESSQQTEVRDDEDEEYADGNRLTTRPTKHLPPPDIYLKLRFAKDSGMPLEDVAREMQDDPEFSKRFINIGDVNAQSVLDGISRQNQSQATEDQSSAQMHYDATQAQRNDQVPGYRGEYPAEWESANSMIAKHIKEANKTSGIRHSTKNRWSTAMDQMSSQLDAIDAMAQNMQDDFKSTESLVKTIEGLTDVMAPPTTEPHSSSKQPVPQKRGLSPVSEASSERTRTPRLSSPVRAYPDVRPYHPTPYGREPALTPSIASHKKNVKQSSHELDPYRSRLDEAFRLAGGVSSGGSIGSGGRPQSSFEELQSSVHSSLSLERELSIISSQRHISPAASRHSSQDLRRSIQDELNDLLQDVSPRDARMKHWRDRTDNEKRAIRRWMAEKRKERTEKYKEQVKILRENEKHPFQPPKDYKATPKRDAALRREMESSFLHARMDQAMSLMDDLRSDHPRLPTQETGTHMAHLSSTPKHGQKSSQRKIFTTKGKGTAPYRSPFSNQGNPPGKKYKANTYTRKQPHLPVSTSKRHLITATGIPSEKSPRSPRAVPYVQQLQQQSKQAAGTHRSKHVDAYRRPGYKPPTYDHLMPAPRQSVLSYNNVTDHQRRLGSGAAPVSASGSDHMSDVSGLSGWSMPDDVKALLYGTDSGRKASKGVTFDLGRGTSGSGNMEDYLPQNSISLADLGIKLDATADDHASQNTESLLGDMDWKDVERMVASVNTNL